uniref:Uncharacterized protein n=1 Tax=Panagrolaimus davidi TaxID=227884 RepID=A0A914QDY7_9BILA
MLTSAESFETMLNRWYKFEPKFCFYCQTNTSQKSIHIIDEKQKYFIVETDSWVKLNKKDIQQCRISSETFNIDSQEIFGKSWKLIAAIYCDGFDRYSTWRRFENKWIVNTNAEFIIVDKLLEDLKNYKIFLFEKLEENGEKHNDEILFDLDYKEVLVCENETYSISVENQDSEITNNCLQRDFMEVDGIHENSYVYPNIFTATPEEQGKMIFTRSNY